MLRTDASTAVSFPSSHHQLFMRDRRREGERGRGFLGDGGCLFSGFLVADGQEKGKRKLKI